jgi:mannose-6-phosphate isomerase-like protein (cupin superfamily)
LSRTASRHSISSTAFRSAYCARDLDASDWERDPDTDELLMVLDGSVTVEVLTDSDSRLVPLTAGQFTIVPRGLWHRHTMARDVIELFYMAWQ